MSAVTVDHIVEFTGPGSGWRVFHGFFNINAVIHVRVEKYYMLHTSILK